MNTTTDLFFNLIDAGYEVGIPGHPDDWPTPPQIERIPPKELISRSLAAELATAEKLKGLFHE